MTLLGFGLVAVSEISEQGSSSPAGCVVSARERAACASRKDPLPRLAARLAAKRACVSAFAPVAEIDPAAVRVTTLSRRPRITIADPRCSGWKVRISLTHSARHAAALCAASRHDHLSPETARHP